MRAYLELLRPANVATALADVLAGFAVAGLVERAALPWLLGATACLYGGGIVLNDVCDRHLDARERPERPIPSGRVPAAHAAALAAVLLLSGVLLAAAANATAARVAAALAGLVVLYDTWGKHRGLFGPVNMGGCRALNLWLGMAAAPGTIGGHGWLGLIPLAYISAVTALSRGEVAGGKRGIAAYALISLGFVLIALLALTLSPGHRSPAGLLLTVVLGWRVLPPFWNAWKAPQPAAIRHAIRTGVLSLVLVDAVIGAGYGGAVFSLAILTTAVLAGWLARMFSVT
jgi:4-hydroxybenzoate polyprenyltransferase